MEQDYKELAEKLGMGDEELGQLLSTEAGQMYMAAMDAMIATAEQQQKMLDLLAKVVEDSQKRLHALENPVPKIITPWGK